jgi:PAS domain-containing protein
VGYQSSGYLRRCVHPDDVEAIKSRAPMLRDENHEFELRLRRNDGVYRWHPFRSFPFRDSSARILRWYLAGIEIENRKQM